MRNLETLYSIEGEIYCAFFHKQNAPTGLPSLTGYYFHYKSNYYPLSAILYVCSINISVCVLELLAAEAGLLHWQKY